MNSQEKLKEILEKNDPLNPEIRTFDWDTNFDYSRYSLSEIERCKLYTPKWNWANYNYYINESQIWKDKRSIRMLIDFYQCRACGCQIDLSVHHKYTAYEKVPYESIQDDLTTLCDGEESCHKAITNCVRKRNYDKQLVEIVPYKNILERKESYVESAEKIEMSPYRNLPTNRS